MNMRNQQLSPINPTSFGEQRNKQQRRKTITSSVYKYKCRKKHLHFLPLLHNQKKTDSTYDSKSPTICCIDNINGTKSHNHHSQLIICSNLAQILSNIMLGSTEAEKTQHFIPTSFERTKKLRARREKITSSIYTWQTSYITISTYSYSFPNPV